MACVMCQFDLPKDPEKLAAYSRWVATEGLADILRGDGLTEMRVYRNHAGASPQVTALIFFLDSASALRMANSPAWHALAAGLTNFGCEDLTLTLLEPSHIIPPFKNPNAH
jgi:hypothetical protein